MRRSWRSDRPRPSARRRGHSDPGCQPRHRVSDGDSRSRAGHHPVHHDQRARAAGARATRGRARYRRAGSSGDGEPDPRLAQLSQAGIGQRARDDPGTRQQDGRARDRRRMGDLRLRHDRLRPLPERARLLPRSHLREHPARLPGDPERHAAEPGAGGRASAEGRSVGRAPAWVGSSSRSTSGRSRWAATCASDSRTTSGSTTSARRWPPIHAWSSGSWPSRGPVVASPRRRRRSASD